MYTSSYTNYTRLLLSKGPSFLVFWPEAVSVVNACKITDPEPDSLQLQQDCKVKVARNIYSGKVAAIGKCYAIILCPFAYCAYFYVGKHKLWFFNVAIVLVGSEEEMKQLANDYETGNWSPFGETDGKVGEEEPGEADSKVGKEKPGETDGKVGEEKPGGAHGKDKEPHAVIATKSSKKLINQKLKRQLLKWHQLKRVCKLSVYMYTRTTNCSTNMMHVD